MDILGAAGAPAGIFLILLLQLQDPLGHPQELEAVLRQAQGPAADKKLGAQLLLQLGNLLGQGLLGNKQVLGRHRDAFFIGHGNKAF